MLGAKYQASSLGVSVAANTIKASEVCLRCARCKTVKLFAFATVFINQC